MSCPVTPRRVSAVELVDFAAAHPRYRRSVDEDIRQDLGITPARYFQLLDRVIATEEALKHDPVTVHRLRRQAEANQHTHANRSTDKDR